VPCLFRRAPLEDRFHTQNLPDTEIGNLHGPATIVGDWLQLSIHKGGDWDFRETTVGVTLIRPGDLPTPFDALKLMAPKAMTRWPSKTS